MHKKNLLKIIMVMIIIVMAVAGCAKKQEEQLEEVQTAATSEPTEMTEVSAGIGKLDVLSAEDEDSLSDDTSIETDEKTDDVSPPVSNAEKQTEATDSTESKGTEGSTEPTAHEEETEATTPADSTTPTVPAVEQEDIVTEYDKYMAMSAEEQQAFIESFPSVDAFMTWFNNAQAEKNATDDSVVIGSGVIDLEELSKNG